MATEETPTHGANSKDKGVAFVSDIGSPLAHNAPEPHPSNTETCELGNASKDGSTQPIIPPNKTGTRSYASLFYKNNRMPSDTATLNFIPPPPGGVVLGCDDLFTVEKALGYCLVGFVMGPRPGPYAMKQFLKGWGPDVKFTLKPNGWIKFVFPNAVDRDQILDGGPYMILGRQLIVRQLPSCFTYSKKDMVILPTWVEIHGLPADCWTNLALSRVASVLGKPLYTDKLTISRKNDDYARVLVEIDATLPRIWDYMLTVPTGQILIEFKYEREPKYCENCRFMGHNTDTCVRTMDGPPRYNRRRKAVPKTTNPRTSGDKDTVPTDNQETPLVDTDIGSSHASPTHDDNGEPQPVFDSEGDAPSDRNMDEENYCSPGFNSEGSDVGSEDIEAMMRYAEMEDKKEWKTVQRKKHRRRNQKVYQHGTTPLESSSSSRTTEYVQLDATTMLPDTHGGSVYMNKDMEEVRLPDTASGPS